MEKKGYSDLLRALAALRDERWRFEHAGGGPLAKPLKAEAARLGIADRITWHGAEDRAFIFDMLRRADLFVLPSRLARSGDRDGLPNVLMEAQAFAVPVVATDVSGIPELVTHGKTGRLVKERDPQALAEAIRKMIEEPTLRRSLAEAGAKNVRARFSSEPGINFVARAASRLAEPPRSRMSDDAKGDAAKARFAALLDKAAARSQPIEFWWRDDDAETTSPALDRLL